MGEILLVVIGILIALEINNANELHKNHEIINTYLENLVKETSLNNTGNIRLLDFELRTAILDYYTDLKLAHQMSKDQLSGYNLLMNSLRPYNPETPDSTTAYSRKYVLEKAKTEEFYQTANLEISSANHNLRRIKNIIAQGENLIKMIENRLKE